MSELILLREDPELGSIIRAERMKRGMTAADLARATGISQPTISRIELRARVPSQKITDAIREVLESYPVLTAEEMAKAEAERAERRAERVREARKTMLAASSPASEMRSIVSKATSPILKRLLALEDKSAKLEERSDRLEDRTDDLDDRTASLASKQEKMRAKAAKPAGPGTGHGIRIERIRAASREEAMDLYEDRIRLLEAAVEAQAEMIAKMQAEMRRRGWL